MFVNTFPSWSQRLAPGEVIDYRRLSMDMGRSDALTGCRFSAPGDPSREVVIGRVPVGAIISGEPISPRRRRR
jgi:hypothetical protein